MKELMFAAGISLMLGDAAAPAPVEPSPPRADWRILDAAKTPKPITRADWRVITIDEISQKVYPYKTAIEMARRENLNRDVLLLVGEMSTEALSRWREYAAERSWIVTTVNEKESGCEPGPWRLHWEDGERLVRMRKRPELSKLEMPATTTAEKK